MAPDLRMLLVWYDFKVRGGISRGSSGVGARSLVLDSCFQQRNVGSAKEDGKVCGLTLLESSQKSLRMVDAWGPNGEIVPELCIADVDQAWPYHVGQLCVRMCDVTG
jgi:hypothetical protein